VIWGLANWRLLITGAAIGLLGILLLFARMDAQSQRKRADQNAALYQVEVAKHAVTRRSLQAALAAIDDQNIAVNALAAESSARTKAAEDGRKAAQEAARASEGKARALDASAAVARSDAAKCAPSDVFWNARKDL
jgi:hypothetical protein